MPPERRRELIIAATWPLVREHGANVTTSQIARAAGIAEGTIFRVFHDKRELLLAALRAAMSADAELERIAAVSAAAPLDQRLLAAMAVVGDYQDRLWSLMRTLQELGWQPHAEDLEHEDLGPRRQMERMAAALAALLPAAAVRLAPLPAARMLLGLSFTRAMAQRFGEPPATLEQLVDVFLHGVLDTREMD
jgi:AcrR family transcriptional regulator